MNENEPCFYVASRPCYEYMPHKPAAWCDPCIRAVRAAAEPWGLTPGGLACTCSALSILDDPRCPSHGEP